MSITIQGLEEINERLTKIADSSNLGNALEKACARVEKTAKTKAPKGVTGELARSITSKVEGTTGTVFAPIDYAPYVEYGTGIFAEKGGRYDVPWVYQDERSGKWYSTSGQKPHPFMRPALIENRDKILKDIKEGIIND